MPRPGSAASRPGPWLALAVLIPVWTWSPRILDDPRLDGALLSALVLALVLLSRGRGVRMPPGTGLFLGALVLGCLPFLVHPQPPPLPGLADRAPWLSAWVLLGLALAHPAGLRRSWPWILGGIFLAAAYGVLQILGFDPLAWRPGPDSPPTAPLAGTNHAAELLAPALLAALCLPRSSTSPRTLRFLGLAALPAAFLGGWLGVLALRISLPLGSALAVAGDRRRWLSAVLLVGAFLLGEAGREWIPPRGAPPSAAPVPPPHSSVEIRWRTDRETLARIAHRPLGEGLGRFQLSYPFWRDPDSLRIQSQDFQDPATPRPKDPHDELLLAFSELGWAGGLFLLGAITLLLGRTSPARWAWPALAAVTVHAMVRSPWSDDPAALALTTLLLATGCRPPAARRGSWALALGLALLATLPAPSQALGEILVGRSFREGGDPVPSLTRALKWRPWDARGWDLLAAARSHAPASSTEEVRAALHQALRADPADLFALTAKIELEMVAGNEREGLAALALAEALAPDHPAVREARTLWVEQQERRQRDAASKQLLAGDPEGRTHLLAAHLLHAYAAIRRGQVEESRKALHAAAFYAEGQRPLVERSADAPELDENLLRALILRLSPTWKAILGPTPGADPSSDQP